MATIQVDLTMLPERFDLTLHRRARPAAAADRDPPRDLRLARAVHRRSSIEHFAGAFPLWCAPVQAVVIPIADRHVEAAEELAGVLRARGPAGRGRRLRQPDAEQDPARAGAEGAVHARPRRPRDRGPDRTVRRRGAAKDAAAGDARLGRARRPARDRSPPNARVDVGGGARRCAAAPGPRPLQHAGHEPDHRSRSCAAVPVVRLAVPRRDGGLARRVPDRRSCCSVVAIRVSIALTYGERTQWLKNVLVAGDVAASSRRGMRRCSWPRPSSSTTRRAGWCRGSMPNPAGDASGQ